jgi:hypothetical protein
MPPKNPPGFVYPDWADNDEKRAAYDGTLDAAHQRLCLALTDLGRSLNAEARKVYAQVRRLTRR